MTEFALQSFKTMVEQAQDLHLVLSPSLPRLCPREAAGKAGSGKGHSSPQHSLRPSV